MKATENSNIYDMIIIGGGPAGYTAALYAVRAGMSTLLLEKLSAGGQMALTYEIDNYPGFENGIDGFSLAEKMKAQAEKFGAKTQNSEVLRLDLEENPKIVETSNGIYRAKTVVLAMGANPRELGLPNESSLVGRGVAYCASCDGMFYRGKTVVVVGGGNTAAEDALLLSRIANKVILVHRRDTLRASKIYKDALQAAENVDIVFDSTVVELLHGDKLTGVRVENTKTGKSDLLICDGLFVGIGRRPATELLGDSVDLDEGGYVIAGEDTKTSIDGVFAIGDVRTKPVRQIVTAASDGAVAVHFAEEYLANISDASHCM